MQATLDIVLTLLCVLWVFAPAHAGDGCSGRSFGEETLVGISPPPVLVPPLPHVLMTTDVDRDGHLDFIILNRGTSEVGVVRGEGDGTFGAPKGYPISSHRDSLPEGLGAADYNGDEYPDVAIVDWGLSELKVYLNDQSGEFPSFDTYVVVDSGSHPHGVLNVDIDLDGDIDIITSNDTHQTVGSLSVFKNNGEGDFTLWKTSESGQRTQFAAAGDFDGDGDPDIASANAGRNVGADPSDQSVTVYRNTGDGTLERIHVMGAPPESAPCSVIAVDLDRDQNLDLVVGSWTSGTLLIYWGNGEGGFSPYEVLRTPGTAVQQVAADLDQNGWLDLAISTFEAPYLHVRWNEGDRDLSSSLSLRILPGLSSDDIRPRYPAVGDFDEDGDLDIASVQFQDGSISVFENLFCQGEQEFVRGDANADGELNLSDAVHVLLFLFAGGQTPGCLDAADINGDEDINLTDSVYLLTFLFLGGPLPPPPATGCGTVPDVEGMGCLAFAACP